MSRPAARAERRLAAVSTHLAAAGSTVWRRVPQSSWRVGDRFQLTDDDEELVRLCQRCGVGYQGGFANGWTGELVAVER